MKTLAATILEQRSELEQFFLESLVEVKSIISERKKKSASASVQDYNQKRASSIRNWGKKPAGIPARTGTFPNIRANRLHHMDDGMRESSLPSNENDKVCFFFMLYYIILNYIKYLYFIFLFILFFLIGLYA